MQIKERENTNVQRCSHPSLNENYFSKNINYAVKEKIQMTAKHNIINQSLQFSVKHSPYSLYSG